MQIFETKESVYRRKEVTPTEVVWDTNMAAVSLFWGTNMAAMTLCENTQLGTYGLFTWRWGTPGR